MVLRVVDARKTFHTKQGDVHALDGLSFDVADGSFCALVGISGSGKSTLLNCIGGLLRLDAGTIHVDGTELGELTQRERSEFRRDRVAMVFQEYNLLPMLTAAENVAISGLLAGRHQDECRDAAIRALDRIGLTEHGERLPHELSGGQRQRVAIARALAAQQLLAVRLLLVDEPSGSLDQAATMEVVEALQGAAREGLGVLVATHDPFVIAAADERIDIRDGRLLEQADA